MGLVHFEAGRNAVLAISMAVCRAGVAASEMTLYSYVSKLVEKRTDKFVLSVPSFNEISAEVVQATAGRVRSS